MSIGSPTYSITRTQYWISLRSESSEKQSEMSTATNRTVGTCYTILTLHRWTNSHSTILAKKPSSLPPEETNASSLLPTHHHSLPATLNSATPLPKKKQPLPLPPLPPHSLCTPTTTCTAFRSNGSTSMSRARAFGAPRRQPVDIKAPAEFPRVQSRRRQANWSETICTLVLERGGTRIPSLAWCGVRWCACVQWTTRPHVVRNVE